MKILVFVLILALAMVSVHDWLTNQDLNRMRRRYYASNQSLKGVINSMLREE